MEDADSHKHSEIIPGESSQVEYFKFVFLILIIMTLTWILTAILGPESIIGALRWFMGIFFVVFAAFKFIGYKMFALMFAGYDIIARRIKAYSYAYPFIELSLGCFYLFNLIPSVRDFLTLLVMSISAIGVAQEIKKRSGIHCACLGNVIKLPLSTVSLIEDIGMGTMALVLLFYR